MTPVSLTLSSLLLSPGFGSYPTAAEAWTLKPNLVAGAKIRWAVEMDIDISGTSRDGTFDFVEEIKPGDASKDTTVHLSIENASIGGAPQAGFEMDGTVNGQNMVTSAKGDDTRPSFTPLLFVYPSNPVSPGDTWKSEQTFGAKGASKIAYDFTAKQVEAVDGVDALMVTSKVKQAGDEGVSADGTWWLDKSGKVLKFKIVAKNWFIPPVGRAFDVTAAGSARP